MIALDFKLTSGQVRALLHVYHGSTPVDSAPVLALFRTPHLLTAKDSLIRKGLITHCGQEVFAKGWHNDPTLQAWTITPAGRALAEMIVTEAHKIVALDISRKEYEARLALAKEQQAGRQPAENAA